MIPCIKKVLFFFQIGSSTLANIVWERERGTKESSVSGRSTTLRNQNKATASSGNTTILIKKKNICTLKGKKINIKRVSVEIRRKVTRQTGVPLKNMDSLKQALKENVRAYQCDNIAFNERGKRKQLNELTQVTILSNQGIK